MAVWSNHTTEHSLGTQILGVPLAFAAPSVGAFASHSLARLSLGDADLLPSIAKIRFARARKFYECFKAEQGNSVYILPVNGHTITPQPQNAGRKVARIFPVNTIKVIEHVIGDALDFCFLRFFHKAKEVISTCEVHTRTSRDNAPIAVRANVHQLAEVAANEAAGLRIVSAHILPEFEVGVLDAEKLNGLHLQGIPKFVGHEHRLGYGSNGNAPLRQIFFKFGIRDSVFTSHANQAQAAFVVGDDRLFHFAFRLLSAACANLCSKSCVFSPSPLELRGLLDEGHGLSFLNTPNVNSLGDQVLLKSHAVKVVLFLKRSCAMSCDIILGGQGEPFFKVFCAGQTLKRSVKCCLSLLSFYAQKWHDTLIERRDVFGVAYIKSTARLARSNALSRIHSALNPLGFKKRLDLEENMILRVCLNHRGVMGTVNWVLANVPFAIKEPCDVGPIHGSIVSRRECKD